MLGDQHGSDEFGRTADEARRAFPDAELALIDMGTGRGDSQLVRAENLAQCFSRAAEILHRRQPEVVLVHGDRAEHLVVALAALTLGMAVAHTQGGDRSGNVDEIQRHAISKLAHLHFPETEEAAERLRRLGEEDWRIHVVGSTYADRIVGGLYASPTEARATVGLGRDEPFLLVIVHPETWRSGDENRRLAEAVLAGAQATGLRSVATYPASDPGYEGVIEALQTAGPDVIVRPNIDQDVYLGLMAEAEALVGNSSAGVIEAPYLRLPAVNVGERQLRRARRPNVVDAEERPASIAAAVAQVRSAEFRAALEAPAGDGLASQRIVDVLKGLEQDARLLRKQLAY